MTPNTVLVNRDDYLAKQPKIDCKQNQNTKLRKLK